MKHAPSDILILGASGGIGRAVLDDVLVRFPQARVIATGFRNPVKIYSERVSTEIVDVRDINSMQEFLSSIPVVDWAINCVGILHSEQNGPEKTIRTLDAEFFMENIHVNTLPTLLMAKQLSSALKKSLAPRLATVSAKVGSISDNRLGGWYSYRASKAALNMALKTISIEWKFSHPRGCVVAFHPGTNDTSLSKPFQTNVPKSNLLMPAESASAIMAIMQGLEPSQTGSFYAWDGELLPW
ncbi:MAG: SDR family NAD(P)-dependent oxidoreductase [Pseudomonadota bacterium]